MLALYIGGPILLLVLIWLFMIAPKKDAKMEKFKCVRYAHRGLHGDLEGKGYAAENSLTAFARAADAGFGIELDVRLTKDGEVVVFHDDTLDRVTEAKGFVKDYTLEELKKLSLEGTADTVPTFSEVLSLVGGRVPLLIEIKEFGMNLSIVDKIAEILKGYGDNFIVESFNPLVLGRVKKVMPNVPRGFLTDKLTAHKNQRDMKHRIVQRLLLNFIARPAFISVRHTRIKMMPIPVVRFLFTVPCVAWTITSKEDESAAYAAGFDGVIFENYIPDTPVREKGGEL